MGYGYDYFKNFFKEFLIYIVLVDLIRLKYFDMIKLFRLYIKISYKRYMY